MNATVRDYNQLAFHVNYIIANRHDDLSLDQVRDAARNHQLIQLLDKRYPFADFYYFVHRPDDLAQLEAGLADDAAWLSWQEGRRLACSKSGLALAMAIILQAIQSANCSDAPTPASPRDSLAGIGALGLAGLAITDCLLAIPRAIRRLASALGLHRPHLTTSDHI